jgi:hypothetical protein
MVRQTLLPCLALMTAQVACRGGDGSRDPAATPSAARRSDVRVTEITLGRALETNRRVTQPLDAFAPGDTIYASVVTAGTARHGLLKARWTYQGSEVLSEASLDTAPSGTTATEFHISRPEGLRPGRYEVEIFLDGVSAGRRTFSVQ